MKIPGEAAERVARSLLEAGPATAAELACRLGLTAAGVRRPLAALVDAGLVAGSERPPYGPAPAPRRGRPSLTFSITQAGRDALNQAYDALALEVLDFVARTQGDEGIRAFAAERAARLVRRLPANPTVDVIADALTQAGYAASVAPSASSSATAGAQTVSGDQVVQLCLHHCPVMDAAVAYPALCEAETTALAAKLGRHVTRLATLAHGDGVCTTVISTGTDVHSTTSDAPAPARKVPA